LTVVGLALAIFVTACKKDKDGGESGKFGATLNGAAFQPTAVVAVEESSFITIAGFQLAANDSMYLSLDIPDTAHVNTSISFNHGNLYLYKGKTDTDYWGYFSPSHGSTTITNWDKTSKTISGNFSGVIYAGASDSIVVTNGHFNTTYTTF